MKRLKAIVVDDEAAARNVLQHLIGRASAPVDVVRFCSNLTEAVLAIRETNPDVVFLDIEMPNYRGYEIASFFETIDFEIIFVTAYDNYAIKAFELSAIDYLVKPIDRSRLNEALEKLMTRVQSKTDATNYHILLENMKAKEMGSMVVSEIGGKRVLKLNTVIAIKADGAYSTLLLKGGEELVMSKHLKQLEAKLPEKAFFRSHKSWIINMREILSFHETKGEILLTDNISVRLSKHRLEDFRKAYQEID